MFSESSLLSDNILWFLYSAVTVNGRSLGFGSNRAFEEGDSFFTFFRYFIDV